MYFHQKPFTSVLTAHHAAKTAQTKIWRTKLNFRTHVGLQIVAHRCHDDFLIR
jgi:hypothetical protein